MPPGELMRLVKKHFEETPRVEIVRAACELAAKRYRGEPCLNPARQGTGFEYRALNTIEREEFRQEHLAVFGVDIRQYIEDPESVLSKYRMH